MSLKGIIALEALIKNSQKVGLSLKTIAMPQPSRDEVLIKILRTSLCGTDLQLYQWTEGSELAVSPPAIIGHEFVGEIVELGSEVLAYEIGQIVSGETHVTCGRCRHCFEGNRHACLAGAYTGLNRSGVFAEYIVLPSACLWVHFPSIDLNTATLFEPLGNAVNAALQFDVLGKDVLITGASPEGLMAAAVCDHAGARHVIVIDTDIQKLRLAIALGATHVLDASDDDIDALKQSLGIETGFDICLEMSGNADAYASVFHHTKRFGQLVLMGVPTEQQAMDWQTVIFKQLTVKGVCGREMPGTWQQMSALVDAGLDLAPLITKRIHYTEFEEGFEALSQDRAGKVIMNWERQ